MFLQESKLQGALDSDVAKISLSKLRPTRRDWLVEAVSEHKCDEKYYDADVHTSSLQVTSSTTIK